MSIAIEDLLHRRSDLSTFVVHLTRDTDDGSNAAQNLFSILKQGVIEARSPMGFAGPWALYNQHVLTEAERRSQRVVAFTETPLEHLYALFAPIMYRDHELKPYGLVFTKAIAREKGLNPVWYVNMSAGFTWAIIPALSELCEAALGHLDTESIGQFLPFIEGMHDYRAAGGGRHDFSWEREWRHRGNFSFHQGEVALVVAPEAEHEPIEEEGWRCIDGSWSLERIIAKLSGVATSGQPAPWGDW